MKITVNGEEKNIEKELTVIEILKEFDVADPDMVSVQLNGEFVGKEDYGTTTIKENDEIDFLYFMGGGQF